MTKFQRLGFGACILEFENEYNSFLTIIKDLAVFNSIYLVPNSILELLYLKKILC